LNRIVDIKKPSTRIYCYFVEIERSNRKEIFSDFLKRQTLFYIIIFLTFDYIKKGTNVDVSFKK